MKRNQSMDGKYVPVIRLFEKSNGFYCYDAYSNNIFSFTEEQYKEAKKLVAIGVNDFLSYACETDAKSAARDIMYFVNSGRYFATELFMESEYPDIGVIHGMYGSAIHDLALQVTKKCNLICRYCQFANDNGISREHEDIDMSIDIAKKAVDFLMEHSSDALKVNIAFCGGEPLLNFGLIRDTIEYVSEKYPFKLVTYNLTSNATLLNDENIACLKKHNVRLMISLDGSEEVQDYNRRFKETGNKTFKLVMDNVYKLMKNYKSYFEKNVTFNSVHLSLEQKKKAQAFFAEHNISSEKVRYVDADLKGTDYIELPNYSDKGNFSEIAEYKTEEWYISRLKKMNEKTYIPDNWHHGGPCIPGIRRLFVDTDGYFFPCEKAIENIGLSVGSLKDGIDERKIEKFLNIGKLTSNECKKCFAFRFCSICAAHCIDPIKGCMTAEYKKIECENQRRIADAFLRIYVDTEM